jgi:hypothetical protein
MVKGSVGDERSRFNDEVAPLLARRVARETPSRAASVSARFACFDSDDALIMVAGVQEGRDCDLALAYGLTQRKGRRLVLVIPRRHGLATMQRSGFLQAEQRPTVWFHDVEPGRAIDGAPQKQDRLTPDHALARLRDKVGPDPLGELRRAATPGYLGARGDQIIDLVEWATGHRFLDPAHRRGERAWHCMGQKVLSIKGSADKGLVIGAGIHAEADLEWRPFKLAGGRPLSRAGFRSITEQVEAGIDARWHDPLRHRPDEHWLQAVIRQQPDLVGVEQPALREVPAWRPVGGTQRWGRGFIDLIGLDGRGDIRIVETKLAANPDELLILQGLDYYVWAQVYLDALRLRLFAAKQAALEVHYVIGADPGGGAVHVSRFAQAQAKALDIPWRFQVVTDWFGPRGDGPSKATAQLWPSGKLPPSYGQGPASS